MRRWTRVGCLRWRRAGTGTTALMVNAIWAIAGIGVSASGATLLVLALHNNIIPEAIQAFTAMFGS
ncbi:MULTISPECIES: hypothetical protein [Alicyclobacillus]|nr:MULTISPECIES: hypothetical protein [Alicyclobacillus]MBF8376807.1 hypothetical protein [Alicyclobacillus mali (ex Roth et al. 2021)]